MKPVFNMRRYWLLILLTGCLLPAGYAHSRISPAVTLPGSYHASVSPIAPKQSPLVHLKMSSQQPGKLNKVTDVYAKMEWEVSSIYEDDYTYIEHWNYFIRFYSDAGGLSQLSLPANLTVYYRWSYDASDGYGHHTETAQALQGDTEYGIPDVQVYYSDPNYYYEVVLELLDGAGYTRLN